MAEWKIAVISGEIKSVQEEMQGELTKVQDVFLKLREEAQILSEKWKGTAAEKFQASFSVEWKEGWQETVGIGKVLSELVQTEKDMEETEKKVQDLLVTGGLMNR